MRFNLIVALSTPMKRAKSEQVCMSDSYRRMNNPSGIFSFFSTPPILKHFSMHHLKIHYYMLHSTHVSSTHQFARSLNSHHLLVINMEIFGRKRMLIPTFFKFDHCAACTILKLIVFHLSFEYMKIA